VGKFFGILVFTMIGIKALKLSLPQGMTTRHLSFTALICGAGLTVSLFVAELAFTDEVLRGEAKLGALLSVVVAPIAIVCGKIFKIATPPQKDLAYIQSNITV